MPLRRNCSRISYYVVFYAVVFNVVTQRSYEPGAYIFLRIRCQAVGHGILTRPKVKSSKKYNKSKFTLKKKKTLPVCIVCTVCSLRFNMTGTWGNVPVNSKTAHPPPPPGIPRAFELSLASYGVACERRRISGRRLSPPETSDGRKYVCVRRLRTVGNLTQNEARPVGHWTFVSKTSVSGRKQKDCAILTFCTGGAAFADHCSCRFLACEQALCSRASRFHVGFSFVVALCIYIVEYAFVQSLE